MNPFLYANALDMIPIKRGCIVKIWHSAGFAIALLTIAACVGPEDLTSCDQGYDAWDAGDYDQAITSFTQCLEHGNPTAEN